MLFDGALDSYAIWVVGPSVGIAGQLAATNADEHNPKTTYMGAIISEKQTTTDDKESASTGGTRAAARRKAT